MKKTCLKRTGLRPMNTLLVLTCIGALVTFSSCRKMIPHTLDISSSSASDGVYRGQLEVKLLGDDYGPYDSTYELKQGMFSSDFPKIGKMPGKIRIDMPVSVRKDGSLSAVAGSVCGHLVMPLGVNIRLTLHSFEDAHVENGRITFIAFVSAKIMGVNFPTRVHFSGYRNNG